MTPLSYRGRLAPSPTGLLHLGHARTFWIASQRCRQRSGSLVFRNEDLDPQRSRPEFVRAIIEDLHWLGIDWDEGPDIGGPHAPYSQSERRPQYLEAWQRLRRAGHLYPCFCSRKDLAQAVSAPNESDDEPLYPGSCRDRVNLSSFSDPAGANWRFRVPNGESIRFVDLNLGAQHFISGKDFGDFLVWRRDDVPAYQLAVVVDDALMKITEIVRGADLLKSTARQMLLWRALSTTATDFSNQYPGYFHCELVRDPAGVRLAKRHDALSIRQLRENGRSPKEVLELADS